MKSMILKILAGILIPVLVSCAAAPPADEEVVSAPEPQEAAVIEENGPVWKIAGETVGSPDGIVDKQIEYTYSAEGRLAEISEHDGRGELLYLRQFRYEDGILVGMVMSDRFGPVSSTIYENDANGLVVRETKQDANGENLSIVTYSYDNGRVSRTVAADGSGIPQLTAEYTYNGDIVAAVAYLLPGGSEEARFERVLESGRPVLEQTVLPDGFVENGKRLEYDGDMLVEEEHFSGGSVIKRVRFDYDSHGNVTRETWTNRSGRDYEVVERRWIQVEEKE